MGHVHRIFYDICLLHATYVLQCSIWVAINGTNRFENVTPVLMHSHRRECIRCAALQPCYALVWLLCSVTSHIDSSAVWWTNWYTSWWDEIDYSLVYYFNMTRSTTIIWEIEIVILGWIISNKLIIYIYMQAQNLA